MQQQVLLGLGGNIDSAAGPPAQTLRSALAMLEGPGIAAITTSCLYATPCFPQGAGPDFVNAAAVLTTTLPAQALLERVQEIEARHGRRRLKRWGQRTLDIDVLGYGEQVLPDRATFAHWRDMPLARQMAESPSRLIVPHPRLHERAFVLVPLNDIAPGWHHPVSRKSVSAMLAALSEQARAQITPLKEDP
ncbi:MAG: 2-amino-4-hydroxy-6-hydroxymethyldihydropteridine diphosphokinase [Rhodobacteraceae bacterium]|nr:2-amino-4-hydroxy-6-hydroxymethyldihydropteridine diphosphokinase [Paracoccaceae bacterium]